MAPDIPKPQNDFKLSHVIRPVVIMLFICFPFQVTGGVGVLFGVYKLTKWVCKQVDEHPFTEEDQRVLTLLDMNFYRGMFMLLLSSILLFFSIGADTGDYLLCVVGCFKTFIIACYSAMRWFQTHFH